jgi:sensor histidine kinase YesM
MLMFFLMMLNLQYASFELVGSFVSKLMLLVLVKIFHIYLSKDTYSGIPQKYKAFVLLFPLSSIVIIICIFYIADQHYSSQMAIISSIACAILLVTNLFALKLYDKIVAEMVLKNLNSRYFTQLQLCEEQIMEREETMLSIRTMRHDLRNHLVLLREMIVHAKKEKVEEYIDSLIIETVNKKQAAANTGNVVIDSLVNFKHGKAMKEGIDVKFNLVVPYNLPCEDADICIILGNILDNAIEAAVQVEPKQRYIDLNITARKNSLAIILKNSYGHSIQTSFEGIIVTTKPNKQRHGYGLFSVQQITDKYNGTMNIEYTDTEFKVTIILFIAYD